jgi:hypothetical protein
MRWYHMVSITLFAIGVWSFGYASGNMSGHANGYRLGWNDAVAACTPDVGRCNFKGRR